MINIEIISALRGAASEILGLRRQLLETKAEAWDVHSEVIRRIFSGPQTAGIDQAWQAEKLAEHIAANSEQVVGVESSNEAK